MLIGRGLEEEKESRQQEVVLSKKLERVVIEENVVVVVVQGGPSKRNGAVGNCRLARLMSRPISVWQVLLAGLR